MNPNNFNQWNNVPRPSRPQFPMVDEQNNRLLGEGSYFITRYPTVHPNTFVQYEAMPPPFMFGDQRAGRPILGARVPSPMPPPQPFGQRLALTDARAPSAPMRQRFERSAKAQPNIGHGRECKFCKNNGETPELYKSHVLRNTATNQLVCPVLREHVCEICHATGDDAHTRNYCPQMKYKLRQAVPVYLKHTARQSDGHLR